MRIYWLNMNLCFHPENEAERLGLERWGDAFGATFGAGIAVGHEETGSGGSGETPVLASGN